MNMTSRTTQCHYALWIYSCKLYCIFHKLLSLCKQWYFREKEILDWDVVRWVFVRIGTSWYVFVRICMYLYVFVRIRTYLNVFMRICAY